MRLERVGEVCGPEALPAAPFTSWLLFRKVDLFLSVFGRGLHTQRWVVLGFEDTLEIVRVRVDDCNVAEEFRAPEHGVLPLNL